MRRLPAPACRRRGLCRLPSRPDRLGAGRAGRAGARHPCRPHLAAEQPPPGLAEGRAGRRRSASTPRRATASSTCANATSCGPSCSRWSQPLRALLRGAEAGGHGRGAADPGRPGRRPAAREGRGRGSRRGRGAGRLRPGAPARPARARRRLRRPDPLGAGAGHGHPRRGAGAAAARRLPPGDGGRGGGAGRGGAARRSGRRGSSPTCSPASAPSLWRWRAGSSPPKARATPRWPSRPRPGGRSGRSSSTIATSTAARSTRPSSTASRRSCSIRPGPARRSRRRLLARSDVPRIAYVSCNPVDLRPRRRRPDRRRLPLRLDPAGRPVPLVDPCRAGRSRSAARR